jgi:hypothetical protein
MWVEDPNKDTENDDDDDGWVDKETLLDHEERLELAANIRPIRLLLVKVITKDSPAVYTLTPIAAPETRLQDRSFHNNPPSCVERNPRRLESSAVNHAAGCFDTLEFNVRHVDLHIGVPASD